MAAPAKATKASDRQAACKKLTTLLKKTYSGKVPKNNLPVLETLLFAACLEDTDHATADAAYHKLLDSFHDLNEIRVSSVREIEEIVATVQGPEWTAVRVRALLRYVFESTYQYDFERLKRLNRDQAERQLKRIDHISPFMIAWVLQCQLGTHVVAMDNAMLACAKWLHLVPPDSSVEQASEYLKSGVKKADVFEFGFLLRSLATDLKYRKVFADESPEPDDEFLMEKVVDHLKDLQNPRRRKRLRKKKVPEKPVVKKKVATSKPPAKKAAASKTAKGAKAATGKTSATKKATKSTASAPVRKTEGAAKSRSKKAAAVKKKSTRTASAKKSSKTTRLKKKK